MATLDPFPGRCDSLCTHFALFGRILYLGRVSVISNPMHRMRVCLVLGLLQQADGHVLPTAARAPRPLRAWTTRMQEVQASSWPPPLDAVHVFNVGGEQQQQMALTSLSAEKRGVLAFWRFLYEHESGTNTSQLAKARAELQAELALASSSTGMMFGVYLDGLDSDEHAIALVRFESGMDFDLSGSSERVEEPGKIMIIDRVMVSPALPPQLRPGLQDTVVQSLRALGHAHEMNVRLRADFGI
jgi:hypothetical protein